MENHENKNEIFVPANESEKTGQKHDLQPKQTILQRTKKNLNLSRIRAPYDRAVGKIQPKLFRGQEFGMWAALADRFGLLVLFLVVLKFVMGRHVLYGYTFWIICYLNILRYRVIQREFLRWHFGNSTERHGWSWIPVWVGTLAAMLALVRIFPDGIGFPWFRIRPFSFPGIESSIILGVVIGQYLSSISSVRRYAKLNGDFRMPRDPIYKLVEIAEIVIALIRRYFDSLDKLAGYLWDRRFKIWVSATDCLGVIVMASVFYKFFSGLEIFGYELWITMYLAILSFTVNQKEFRVWRNEHTVRRPGGVWVAGWIAAFVSMQIMATYIPHAYTFPEVEIFIITGVTFGHYLTTMISRSKYLRTLKRSEPETRTLQPRYAAPYVFSQ